MLRSPGARFFTVALLALLMFIPVFFVSDIVKSRADYSRDTLESVGREWGGPQLISGPVLVLPVEETVMVRHKREVLDPVTNQQMLDANDNPVFEFYDTEEQRKAAPVYIYPSRFDVEITTAAQERHRGIFTVPVFHADTDFTFDFPHDLATGALTGNEVILWDKSEIRISLSRNAALRGPARLQTGGADLPLEPLVQTERGQGGVSAALGDPRRHGQYRLTMGFNGAQSLSLAPVGRESKVTIQSDWPHPSFFGAFLPDGSTVTETGFQATWTIPHLARPLPQVDRSNHDKTARISTDFGVRFMQPNDFYQKAFRAARYAILFIGLTFLTVMLIEGRDQRPTHPVQYILIGLAQATFVLLMVSLAEQIGFGRAYFAASAATIALITLFGWTALGMGRRALVLGLMLSLLYGVLYLILRSADYALLAGSTLAFGAIAGTMFATRNENWYGTAATPRRSWFRRGMAAPDTSAPAPSPEA